MTNILLDVEYVNRLKERPSKGEWQKLWQENKQLKKQLKVRGERMEEMESLQDTLRNGIKYDEENNQYVLCWTEREIEQAQKEADEMVKFFKKLPEADDGKVK